MSRRCSQHSYLGGLTTGYSYPLVTINSLAFASQLITVLSLCPPPSPSNNLLTIGFCCVVGFFFVFLRGWGRGGGGGLWVSGVLFQLLLGHGFVISLASLGRGDLRYWYSIIEVSILYLLVFCACVFVFFLFFLIVILFSLPRVSRVTV